MLKRNMNESLGWLTVRDHPCFGECNQKYTANKMLCEQLFSYFV